MTTRLDVISGLSDGPSTKVDPLFTASELGEWERLLSRDVPWDYQEMSFSMYKNELCRRVHSRPEPYLDGLLLLVGSKGTDGPRSLRECYTPELRLRYFQSGVSTDENRWWLLKILEGVADMPRSYGMSAAIRYFRGIGKQAKLDKPSVGLLSRTNGWKAGEVETVCRSLISNQGYRRIHIGAPFYQVEDQGIYSDVDMSREEREKLWDSGGAFSATRVERDDEFLQELIIILKARGVKQPPLNTNPKKAPKPRKAKSFQVGDVIKPRYVRDLLPGTEIVKGPSMGDSGLWQEGKVYIWHSKNEGGHFVREDPTEPDTRLWKYRHMTTDRMDGAIVHALPDPVDHEGIKPDDG